MMVLEQSTLAMPLGKNKPVAMKVNNMLKEKLTIFMFFFSLLFLSCQPQTRKNTQMQILKLNFQEGDLPSLYPHEIIGHLRGSCITKNLFEGLTRYDAQGQAKLSGAKSVEVSPDRLRYTFILRDNTWSNGTPVTAFHYENAWKGALSPKSTCPRADLLYMIRNAKEA
jgi:oligopeptide transport system substrate-binding protein